MNEHVHTEKNCVALAKFVVEKMDHGDLQASMIDLLAEDYKKDAELFNIDCRENDFEPIACREIDIKFFIAIRDPKSLRTERWQLRGPTACDSFDTEAQAIEEAERINRLGSWDIIILSKIGKSYLQSFSQMQQ